MNLNIKRKIDRAFFNYKSNIAAGVHSTVEWAQSNMAMRYDRPAVQSSPGRKREERLCAVIDDNMNKYKWCRVVENVLIKYHGEYKDLLIDLRFFRKMPIEQVSVLMNVDRATIFRWLNDIRECARMWAEEYKLL